MGDLVAGFIAIMAALAVILLGACLGCLWQIIAILESGKDGKRE